MFEKIRRIAVLWLFVLTCTGTATAAGWLADWGYRQQIVVNPGMTTADLSGFPLLVSITDSGNGVFSGAASPLGRDIVFTGTDGVSIVPHEVESFEASGSSQLAAWVKTDVSAASPTTLYMYYGNPDGVDYQQINNTWDFNHRAVQHLQGDPTGTVPQFDDSTSRANHGVAAGATVLVQTPGRIAGAVQFDGGGGRVDMAGNASLEITDQLTLSAWIKPDANDGKLHTVVAYGGSELNGYHLGWDDRYTPDRVWFSVNDTRPLYNTLHSGIALEAGQWYHLATTYTPTTMEVFVNGQSKGTRTPTSTLGGYNNSTVSLGGRMEQLSFRRPNRRGAHFQHGARRILVPGIVQQPEQSDGNRGTRRRSVARRRAGRLDVSAGNHRFQGRNAAKPGRCRCQFGRLPHTDPNHQPETRPLQPCRFARGSRYRLYQRRRRDPAVV